MRHAKKLPENWGQLSLLGVHGGGGDHLHHSLILPTSLQHHTLMVDMEFRDTVLRHFLMHMCQVINEWPGKVVCFFSAAQNLIMHFFILFNSTFGTTGEKKAHVLLAKILFSRFFLQKINAVSYNDALGLINSKIISRLLVCTHRCENYVSIIIRGKYVSFFNVQKLLLEEIAKILHFAWNS